MRIQIKTIGTMKALEAGTGVEILEVPEGSSVAEVMALLKIPDWEVGFIKIDDVAGCRESILRENDNLILIAPLVGG